MLGNKKTVLGRVALIVALATSASSAIAQNAASGTGSSSDQRVIDPRGGTIDPFAGNLDPFAGNLDPFGGNIDPFGRTIDPFAGNIDPFGRNIDPFRGNLDPFNGAPGLTSATVGQFWGQFGTIWKEADTAWSALSAAPADSTRQTQVVAKIQALVSHSQQFWGARVSGRTGQSFQDGFVKGLFAKYGISLSDPASFARLTVSQRSQLVFEWYDGLQELAGVDHVDHWMNTVNWNPNITKTQGSGTRSIIGLIDGSIGNDSDLRGHISSSNGHQSQVNGHGAGVLSLIVAAHDGRGVQGIAPQARVITYNPFDDTNTASWDDIKAGIVSLKQARASVINLSLGVRGSTLHPEWSAVFSDAAVRPSAGNTVYVLAAGNDGTAQTQNVTWQPAGAPAILVVGSVDPSGTISSFSNRPGTACLTTAGICASGNRLADRFLVAPGELLLVADGNGGFSRVSGTSFAAPLVSGTVTLLHNRWPWLANYANETANIILSSARDLGAPGTDDVYGRGLLDVEASQSPLSFANLEYYEFKGLSFKNRRRTLNDVRKRILPKNWEADGVFYYALEYVGATHRDFAIPISTRLIGQKTSVNGSEEYFQGYVANRMNDWIKNGGGFTDVRHVASPGNSDWSYGFNVAAPSYDRFDRSGFASLPSPNVHLAGPGNRFALDVGHGNGIRSLAQQKGFGLASDYDSGIGGINPVLGLASGGAFMNADFALLKNTRVAVGFTENRLPVSQNMTLNQVERQQLRGVDAYRANAVNVRVSHQPTSSVMLTADYSKVHENNGLLGVQSSEQSDLGNGTSTQTASVGASIDMPGKITLAGSATAAWTKSTRAAQQAFQTMGSGVMSSAYAMSLSKQGVMGRHDVIRFSLTQPLTIERGTMSFTSVQVVDRETGALGDVTQTFDISSKSRRLTGELMYAAPVLKSGEVSLFGRMDYRLNASDQRRVDGIVIGGRVRMPF
jgi:hypothetical protein